jgi:hypothetical protein
MIKYFIIVILLLSSALAFNIKELIRANNNIDRLEENFIQMHKSNISLKLTLDEFKVTMTDRMDSVLEKADIKPKWIKQYNEINHYYYDTVEVVVPTTKVNDSTYTFLDTKDCFSIGGNIVVADSKPKLNIDYRAYNTNIDYILYQNRAKYQFLFWKWRLFGKKENNLYISSDCGETKVKRIDIIKK